MIEWFFFDGVDAKSTRAPISCKYNLVVFVCTNKTKPPLTNAQLTFSGAHITPNAAIIKRMPVLSWKRFILHSNRFARYRPLSLIANSIVGFWFEFEAPDYQLKNRGVQPIFWW